MNLLEPEMDRSESRRMGFLDYRSIWHKVGLREGDVVADLACGWGYSSLEAARVVGEEGEVYAVDISEETMARVKETITKNAVKNVTPLVGDITKVVLLNDGTVDVVLMANILHGLVITGGARAALREVNRILKPHGLLVIVDFRKVPDPPGPPYSIRLSLEEVEAIVGLGGFETKEHFKVEPYHYTVVFRKKVEDHKQS